MGNFPRQDWTEGRENTRRRSRKGVRRRYRRMARSRMMWKKTRSTPTWKQARKDGIMATKRSRTKRKSKCEKKRGSKLQRQRVAIGMYTKWTKRVRCIVSLSMGSRTVFFMEATPTRKKPPPIHSRFSYDLFYAPSTATIYYRPPSFYIVVYSAMLHVSR